MEDARDEPLSTDSDMPNGDLSRCDTSGSKQQVVVIDANGSNWHRSPILSWQEYGSEMKRFSAEGEERAGIPAVLDFDLLCATIAMEREPVAVTEDNGEACEVGVQRMWEGGVLDCMDNKEIALQTLCCPSITYGKNLQRAGFGSSIAKGGVHFLLLFGAFISYVLFMCDYGHQFLYLSVALLISVAAIASYYRIRIRRRFNIKGSESDGLGTAFDDSLNHFVCGWCTLCQVHIDMPHYAVFTVAALFKCLQLHLSLPTESTMMMIIWAYMEILCKTCEAYSLWQECLRY